jgi:hypothetical protein
MIHVILEGQKAGDLAKALFFKGESYFPPLSLEPTFPNCFRIFSKLEVVTNEDRDKFMAMLAKMGTDYGNPVVRPDSGAFLGFAGHWPYL